MIPLRLDNGKSITVPLHASDMTFGQMLDFKAGENRYFAYQRYLALKEIFQDYEGSNSMQTTQAAINEMKGECQLLGGMELSEADSNLFHNSLSQVVGGDLDGFDLSIDEKIDQSYTISIGDDLSLERIYYHVINVIQRYQPSVPMWSDYQWGEYVLPVQMVRGLIEANTLTAGEFIEMQYLAELNKRVTSGYADVDGNMQYRIGLSQMAVLLKKEGESVPSQKSERDAWLSARCREMKDIPLDVYFDVCFFLSLHLKRSLRDQIIKHTSKVRSKSPRGKVVSLKRGGKPKTRRRKNGK